MKLGESPVKYLRNMVIAQLRTRTPRRCPWETYCQFAGACIFLSGTIGSNAAATVIANFPSETSLSSIGEPFAPYFAQTFKALAPGIASELAIELAHEQGPDDLEFRILVTEISGYGDDFHPTAVLFESSTNILGTGSPATLFRISLPNLQLQPGTSYAFILDAFVTRDGSVGTARVGTNSTYIDGGFYFNQGFGGENRSDHFADQWFFAESIYPPSFHDLSFELSFVPEPSTGVLALLGIGAAMQRRRGSDNVPKKAECLTYYRVQPR